MNRDDYTKREAAWDKKHAEFVKSGMTGKEAYIAANKWESRLQKDKEAKTCQSNKHSLTL